MTQLPLFYRAVVPLDREGHRGLRLANPQRFGFARGSHLVPAVVDEFAAACRHLPILFLPESLGPTPVFLTGLVPGRSALVSEDGTWTGRYLPAYLRRFPFILGESEGRPALVCLDDTAEGVLREEDAGESLALFGEDGAQTPPLQERVRLVADYAEAAKRTGALGRVLQDLGLLRGVTLHGKDPATGESHALHGALVVDEGALNGLSDEVFLRLRREGWLAAISAHLVSLQAIGDFALTFAPPAPANAESLGEAA
ncbi:SapC family protein [Methylobacterium sp. 4-46]|uniref:SapC family protein n=1 Tax=unclassified Methylobacterium TaxID=2615210 RepID=UPI000152C408|nr:MULTISPECIES: SapC family protein [Methylobacterium]ACA14876.1 SapC family protein [Methylobacterium sp. 4-46]WFT80617.1 SapC family protein [Methylobacterium nodulans]